ncbi:MAG: cytochrome P460 family protein, partial [Candidatus Eremiobacteraeota bacterium]|nr:cytochrome P460 family protein [Candidatus Eremiobacteraeota bacterium]
PAGVRDWKVIAVAHAAGKNNDLRVVLGTDIAMKAFRDGRLPFPNGTIIARMAWHYTPSAVNNRSFGDRQSWVAGTPINTQVDVKDSRKYASTGGWGFAQFKGGQPDPSAAIATCYACHTLVKANDFVFTHYARTP